MGIFSIASVIKNKVAGAVGKVAGVAGDAVTKVSVLSPKQLEDVANKKSEYFTELISRDMGNEAANILANRIIGNISVDIYNAYLSQISEVYAPIDSKVEYGGEFNSNFNIRYINITKWVTDKSENSLEKLVNVYEVLSNENCNIALIFNRKMDKTEVYIGIVNRDNDTTNNKVETYADRIADAIKGNFPGSKCQYDKKENSGRIPIFNDKHLSVASISNIPTEKSDKFNTQTIEKLIDGIVPDSEEKEWTLVLIASPILDKSERKLKIGEYYSALSPYKSWETNYTFLETSSNASAAAIGINLGGNSTTSQTYKHSLVRDAVSSALNLGIIDLGGVANLAFTALDFIKQGKVIDIASIVKARTIPERALLSGNKPKEVIKEGVEDVKKSLKTVDDALNEEIIDKESHSDTSGKNFGLHFLRASAQTATIGKNEGITQHFENYNITHTLDMLKEQMNRMELSSALGLWDFAAYVLSEDVNVANNVAHSYLALTQGEKSYLAEANVNVWRGDLGENSKDAKEIVEYLKDLRHPIFGISPDVLNNDLSFALYPTAVTATTELTGKELAYSLNFPKKSVSGLPIIECAEFGRSIASVDKVTNDENVEIGNIYHMQHRENAKVALSKNSLRKHTLICGDSGTGKTNASMQIIKETLKNDAKILIIEMENDEYSAAMNNEKLSFVKYGTNEKDKKISINLFKPKDDENKYTNPLVELFAGDNEFDSFKSLFGDNDESIENILNNNIVIDLSSVASYRLKSTVALGILYKIKEYLETKGTDNTKELNHLIAIDDFQVLTGANEFNDSNNEFIYGRLLYGLLGKYRKWKEGIILITKDVNSLNNEFIKETNNKILFRTTDESERRLLGKSIGLNDLQIDELAKLKDGIAVVYQNEWMQPVLCEIKQ